MIRRGFATLLRAAALTGSVLLVVGALLRVTIRDSIDGLAVLFYLTPWPVIAAGTAVLAVYWRQQKRPRRALVLAGLALVALTTWLASSWYRTPHPGRRGELRVVQWNASRPHRRLPYVARWLRAQDADIITLAEGHHRRLSAKARWEAEFPGYQVVELPGEMTCLIRGQVLAQENRRFVLNSFYALLHVEIRGHPVTLMQVDLNPMPLSSREPSFTGLTALTRPHYGENFILLGDFNTPRESAYFAPLRAEMNQAFEAAGHGLAETWPMPLPVLSLDQIWSSRRLRAIYCEHGSSFFSDHRAVVADFDFATP